MKFKQLQHTADEIDEAVSSTAEIPVIRNQVVQIEERILNLESKVIESTGDSTDRTSEILSALETGLCTLGKGRFYVNNLDMPEGSCLTGSGNDTVIVLADGDNKYAIKMANQCSVSNLAVFGADLGYPGYTPDFTVNAVAGNRNGIVWGVYGDTNKRYGRISGVTIAYFNGGGIKSSYTGTDPTRELTVTDTVISSCDVGIYISVQSEYNLFSDITINNCHYGVINNGGNNSFVNCSFTKNKIGFMIDNSSDNKANNGHGQCVGCMFNHSGDNAGTAIKLVKVTYGFVFSSCQIWYGKIYVKDSPGIIFDGILSGGSDDIEVICENVNDKVFF